MSLSETEKILAQSDPVLESIIRSVPKPEVVSSQNVFHDLVSCIVEQQIHYRSTKNIFKNLLAKSGLTELHPHNFDVFEENALSGIKISMGKYEALLRVCEYFEQNTIDWFSLTDEEVISRLSAIKGIGTWTMDMILLYTLQRKNVFPADDFHLKQIMVSLYGLNEKVKLKAQMLDIAEAWKPEKSLAVLYLLEWKKNQRKR